MNTDTIDLYGPVVIMTVALVWAVGRILYLGQKNNVSVLSFMAQEKTLAERGLGATALILDGYLLLRPFMPDLDKHVYAFDIGYPVLGVTIMATGIAIMILSQINMGTSWRIGVPKEKEPTQTLIDTGIYRFSRNPIYVAIMLFLLGATIIVPGPITIAATLITGTLIGSIVQREESFLAEIFGEEYEAYCQKVRRWI